MMRPPRRSPLFPSPAPSGSRGGAREGRVCCGAPSWPPRVEPIFSVVCPPVPDQTLLSWIEPWFLGLGNLHTFVPPPTSTTFPYVELTVGSVPFWIPSPARPPLPKPLSLKQLSEDA